MKARDTRVSGSKPVLARFGRIAGGLAGVALVLLVLDLLGVPVGDWIRELFKQVRAVPAGTIVGGIALDSLQTVFAAVTWLTILRAAFPQARVPFRPVLAAYAVGVALNGFLPANIGSLVTMLMFVTLIAGATFAAVFAGFVVQKIPFTVLSVLMYVYLFATVPGSLSLEFGFLSAHPLLSVAIVAGVVVLLVIVARFFWYRATKLRDQLKSGGAVLGQPRRFMVGVALPAFGSFAARLGIVAVFLAAFSIPVSFHTVVAVAGANSLSNNLSFTPGSVGVTQALNVVVLQSVTSASNATAYSVAQQLIISAWDVVFAILLMSWVFGWSGGRKLLRESYAAAEVKERELKQRRQARRAATGGGSPAIASEEAQDEAETTRRRGLQDKRAKSRGNTRKMVRPSRGIPAASSIESWVRARLFGDWYTAGMWTKLRTTPAAGSAGRDRDRPSLRGSVSS